ARTNRIGYNFPNTLRVFHEVILLAEINLHALRLRSIDAEENPTSRQYPGKFCRPHIRGSCRSQYGILRQTRLVDRLEQQLRKHVQIVLPNVKIVTSGFYIVYMGNVMFLEIIVKPLAEHDQVIIEAT